MHGRVLNIQRFCVHDGPGIRTTVFLKGCPLRCAWCHNPESVATDSALALTPSLCMQCGQCSDVCPHRASGTPPDQESPDCTRCGQCVDICPTGARRWVGGEMAVDQVVRDVLRDRQFYDQSGGGVTISGGEPLSQPQFVMGLLRALRAESIHTALDTCGYAPSQVVLDAAPLVDLFLFDIKSLDDQKHRAHTGVSNTLILENLRALGSTGNAIWIRIPLIPGFNLEAQQLTASARLIRSISGVRQVNLLPYHEMGTHKALRPGLAATARPEPITEKQIHEAAEIFRAAGLRTVIGG